MGIPLEEMDAVFGEGAIGFIFLASRSLTPRCNLDEFHGFYENRGSEEASLVGGTRSGRSPTRRLPTPSFLQIAREWLSGVVSKSRDRSAYEPITGDE